VLALAFLAILARALFGPHKAAPLVSESRFTVQSDASSIRVTDPHGTINSVAWSGVRQIIIRTTDNGPWGTDVIWLLCDSSGATLLAFPGGATGGADFLRQLQALPGFDNDAVIHAMGCTDNRLFSCWSGQVASAPSGGAA
jgi:hypothetical protein